MQGIREIHPLQVGINGLIDEMPILNVNVGQAHQVTEHPTDLCRVKVIKGSKHPFELKHDSDRYENRAFLKGFDRRGFLPCGLRIRRVVDVEAGKNIGIDSNHHRLCVIAVRAQC